MLGDQFNSSYIIDEALINELINIVSTINLPSNTIKSLYNNSAPRGLSLPTINTEPELITNVIKNLANTLKQSDGSHPMLKFVSELSNRPEAITVKTKLTQWLQKVCLVLDTNLNTLTTSMLPSSREPHLLIKLKTKNSKKSSQEPLYTVKAWIFCPKYSDGYCFFEDERPKPLSKISILFKEIYEKSWNEIDQNLDSLSIAFILPTNCIDHNVYNWIINPGIKDTFVGVYHRVTIRPFERIYAGRTPVFDKCRNKWEQFKQMSVSNEAEWIHEEVKKPITELNTNLPNLNECEANNIILSKESSSTNITLLFEKFLCDSSCNQLNADKCLGLILIVDMSQSLIETTFAKILNSGVPVVLWVNKKLQIEHYNEVLDLLLSEQNLTDLPKLVLNKRQKNQEIILLWDDFDILPPDITNSLRQPEEFK